MKLLIDVDTRVLKRSASTGDAFGPLNLYLKDKVNLRVGFLEGTTIISDALLHGKTLEVAIRAYPGAVALVFQNQHTIDGDLYAVVALDLSDTDLLAYFAANVASGSGILPMTFDVTVVDGVTSRETYYQGRVTISATKP